MKPNLPPISKLYNDSGISKMIDALESADFDGPPDFNRGIEAAERTAEIIKNIEQRLDKLDSDFEAERDERKKQYEIERKERADANRKANRLATIAIIFAALSAIATIFFGILN
ncbi:MAG: hypothetical protein FWB71_00780 [Defluviitaleaceae bacterium]|nr:hypothetical protein [Defluviitaleaceae bacterium]